MKTRKEVYMSNKMNKNNGFTLIELMITVAIIAIIMGVALPSYFQQIVKSNRADAKVELLRLAQVQESYFTQNLSYANSLTQLGLSGDTTETEHQHYTVTVFSTTPGGCTGTAAAPSCQGFTLKATPASSTQLEDSHCTEFTLSNTGLKGTSTGATADEVRMCWK